MSETTGPKPTDDQALEIQKKLGLEDGTQVTIEIRGGRVNIKPNKVLTGSQLHAILGAAIEAFYLEMENRAVQAATATRH